jgi:putative ABC transport system permease protein
VDGERTDGRTGESTGGRTGGVSAGGAGRAGKRAGEMGLSTLARAHLWRYKGKSLLIIVGLATAVAAFVAVMSMVASLQGTMEDRLARYGASLTVTPHNPELQLTYGGITVATAGTGQAALLGDDVLSRIEGIPSGADLTAVIPVAVRSVVVGGVTGTGSGADGAAAGGGAANGTTAGGTTDGGAAPGGVDVLAVGTDLATSFETKPWWHVEGAVPQAEDQVLLGLHARNKLGAEVGTYLEVEGRRLLVSGVLLETGGEEDNALIMAREQLAALVEGGGQANLVEVTVAGSAEVEAVADEIRAALPGVEVSSIKQTLEFNAQANSSLSDAGIAATVLIVLVVVFVVVLTLLAAVRERQREVGVLRALGFRARDVVSVIFRESLLLSVIAAFVGLGLGLLAAALTPRVLTSLTLDFTVNVPVIVAALVMSPLLAGIATAYPAWAAVHLDPAAAFRKL